MGSKACCKQPYGQPLPTKHITFALLCSFRACAGQGGITAPGSICATPVESPIDIEEGLPAEVPLVYFYGHANADANPDLYKFLVERLANLLDRRTQQNSKVLGKSV